MAAPPQALFLGREDSWDIWGMSPGRFLKTSAGNTILGEDMYHIYIATIPTLVLAYESLLHAMTIRMSSCIRKNMSWKLSDTRPLKHHETQNMLHRQQGVPLWPVLPIWPFRMAWAQWKKIHQSCTATHHHQDSQASKIMPLLATSSSSFSSVLCRFNLQYQKLPLDPVHRHISFRP